MSVENKYIPEPAKVNDRVTKTLLTVFTCFLACALYFHFFVNTASVEIELTVAQKTDFKIYWAKADTPYSEKNMAAVIATPDQKHYNLSLTDIGKVARLRIDTHSYKGEATLKGLAIRQEGWAPIILTTTEQLGKLLPLQQIVESRTDIDGLWVRSSGSDGNFELLLAPERLGLNLIWLLLRLAAIAGIVICVLYGASPQVYADLVRWSGVMLLVLAFLSIFRNGGLIGSGLAIAALGISGGIIGIALYHSWTIDFQPQGRCLLAIVPIFGILYGLSSTVINRRLLILGLTPLFLLATYGFIFSLLNYGGSGYRSAKHPTAADLVGKWKAEGTSYKDQRTYSGTYDFYAIGNHTYDIILSDGVHKQGRGIWSLMEGKDTLQLENDTGAVYFGTVESGIFTTITLTTTNNQWGVVFQKEGSDSTNPAP